MSAKILDAIIIGAGHNGLVAANYLAKAGQRVLVLESAAHIGGAATSHEIANGYFVPALAHLVEALPRSIERDLKLSRHGLRYPKQKMASIAIDPDGDHLFLDGKNPRLTASDQDAFDEFRREMSAHASLLGPLLKEAPVASQQNIRQMLRRLNYRMIFSRHVSLPKLLQLMPQSIGDRLDATFDNPRLKGALAADALLGGNVGPYEPGTWFRLVYREAMRKLGRGVSLPLGGVPALIQSLANAATANGAEIRLDAKVTRIITRHESVTGVQIDSGEILSAPLVISSLDPLATLNELLEGAPFEAQASKRLKKNKSRGMSAKINFALDKLPAFKGLDEKSLSSRLLIAPALDELDRAYIQAKRGAAPVDALYEIVIPTIQADGISPLGGHVMSIIKHYAPFGIGEGDDPLAHMINTLEGYAPGISSSIVAAEYLSPQTIEQRFALRGGGWFQGDMRPDQLIQFRPAPGFAHNSTSISGLYLCGVGCHPGGGISGLSGKFAAEAALSRRQRK